METLVEKEERSDRYTLRSVGFFDLHHTLADEMTCSLRFVSSFLGGRLFSL